MLRCVIDLNMFHPHLIRRAERAHQEAWRTDVDDRCYDCTYHIFQYMEWGDWKSSSASLLKKMDRQEDESVVPPRLLDHLVLVTLLIGGIALCRRMVEVELMQQGLDDLITLSPSLMTSSTSPIPQQPLLLCPPSSLPPSLDSLASSLYFPCLLPIFLLHLKPTS